jgi:succinate-acetate transporter protein
MADHDGVKPNTVHMPAPVTANPVPLGLFAFGTTTFVLSCVNAGIFGMSVTSPPNVVIGMALFYGGLTQLLCGMWGFRFGNTFAATVFGTYGSFWLSYATILIPWFNVSDGYVGYERDVGSAIGIFLLSFAIITFMMWFSTLRTNIALVTLFTFLTITFTLLSIAYFKRADGLKVQRAGGFFGIFTAIIAWYIALANLLTKENCGFTMPVGPLSK